MLGTRQHSAPVQYTFCFRLFKQVEFFIFDISYHDERCITLIGQAPITQHLDKLVNSSSQIKLHEYQAFISIQLERD